MKLRAAGLALALSLSAGASAQPEEPDVEAVTSVEDMDPAELARAVDRTGDGAVLALLEADDLHGIYAAPHMAAPELALPKLSALACGRDPWLAPAAMQAILDIADGPLLDRMDRREREPSSLEPVLSDLTALASDETARADLRAAAELARAQLSP